MARPRFTGQGFTNPIDSLGFNAESRHRAMPPISNAFMSDESNYRPTKVFHGIGGKIGGEVVEKGVKKGFLSRIGGAFKFGRKGAAKEGGGEVAEEGAKDAIQASIKAQNKALMAQAKNPAKKSLIRTGGAVVVALYGINVLGEPVVENLTGANCDEKAIDAGYEEGTEEFTQYVEDCQSDAANKLMMAGVAVLGVVGILAVILLRSKKSGSDDGDDE